MGGADADVGSGDSGVAPDVVPLLEAAARGDERAWRGLVDLYARRVYALARSRLGGGASGGSVGGFTTGSDIAEELTQSVFCTIAGKLAAGGYTEKGRFESWLFRVAMNRVRDEARRRKRHAEPTDPEAFGRLDRSGRPVPDASDRADPDDLTALRQAMEHLGEADREVIELRHHAGLSFKQISETLDEPLGTLLARHHRALKKLKDLMTTGGSSEPAPGPSIVGDTP